VSSAVTRLIKRFCFVFVCIAPVECHADFLASYIMVVARKRISRTEKGYLGVYTDTWTTQITSSTQAAIVE
jgi:hypothetical protein